MGLCSNGPKVELLSVSWERGREFTEEEALEQDGRLGEKE